MSKKLKRIQKRKERLEELVRCHEAFCSKHQRELTIYELFTKICYNGNHGRDYCKYLRIGELYRSEYGNR